MLFTLLLLAALPMALLPDFIGKSNAEDDDDTASDDAQASDSQQAGGADGTAALTDVIDLYPEATAPDRADPPPLAPVIAPDTDAHTADEIGAGDSAGALQPVISDDQPDAPLAGGPDAGSDPAQGSVLSPVIADDSPPPPEVGQPEYHALGDGDDTLDLGGDDTGALPSWLRLVDGAPVLSTGGILNHVVAGGGDDLVQAGADAAQITGGAGSDTIMAGAGAIIADGGAGDDHLIGGDGSDGSAYLAGGIGNDLIRGGAAAEYLEGGSVDAGAPAGSDEDTIFGHAGDDSIRGGEGADSLEGGAGDDVINHFGHALERTSATHNEFSWHEDNAIDRLDGGGGNDTLILGENDIATGGTGEDVFWLYTDDAGDASAEITDFVPGEDFLRVTLNPDMHHSQPKVAVGPSADGQDAFVSINDEVIAYLRGAPAASLADIFVEVAEDVFPTGTG